MVCKEFHALLALWLLLMDRNIHEQMVI